MTLTLTTNLRNVILIAQITAVAADFEIFSYCLSPEHYTIGVQYRPTVVVYMRLANVVFSKFIFKNNKFQLEIIINVFISSFWLIWIPMLWVYDYYKYFYSSGAAIDFSRQNLTSVDVRFWRLNSSRPVSVKYNIQRAPILTSVITCRTCTNQRGKEVRGDGQSGITCSCRANCWRGFSYFCTKK